MRLVLALALFLLSAAPLHAAAPYPGFRTPSGNISCGYSAPTNDYPGTIRCDIRTGLKPQPRRRCELDWTGLAMSPTGRGEAVCAGDTIADPRLRVLAYGRTWKHAQFACVSTRAGLTCRNTRGHGFFLSRARWRVF